MTNRTNKARVLRDSRFDNKRAGALNLNVACSGSEAHAMPGVNVLLADKLLSKINAEAKSEGISRSSVIRTALEEYLQTKRQKREEEERRRQMREASHRMDELAKKLGNWNAQAIIRKFQDTNLKGR